VIDIQPLSEAAVHVQLAAVVTVTEPDPPDASKESVDGESVYEHGVGAGSPGDLEPQATEVTANTRSRAKDRLDTGSIGHLIASIHC
jgi:hypothetical protein